MDQEHKSFTKEFKRDVVKLAAQPGASLEWIAKDLGISMYLLRRWSRDATASASTLADNSAAVAPD